MKSIKYVQNGKGQLEPSTLKSTNGLSILNAAGDVSSSSTGFQIAIDTLTYIKKQITDQKFYEVPIADFVPLAVGDGAFAQNILTNLSFTVGDDFETGNVNTGVSGGRLAQMDAAIASKTVKVANWAKQIGYTIFDIEQALQSNNWDMIESKHKARKKNWDLGLQEIAFLGSKSDAGIQGLINNVDINVNTTFITAALSGLDATNFNAFIAGLIGLYFTNTASTAMPNRMIIPYSDYLGLQSLTPGTVGTYPISKLEYMENAFKKICGSEFKIMPLAYADAARNNSLRGINKNIYLLYRHDPESVRMDIPVDYTTTQPNSLNNFSFNDVAYGQYTGTQFYRVLEGLQFQY